jgi:hypothetical protein
MPNSATSSYPPSSRPQIDFPLILLLFFSSRVMLLLAYPPEDLVIYGDYPYYFRLAELTRQGFYPFFHYWQEYPPIFPYLNLIVYTLAGPQFKNHILLLAFVFLLFDCGNLYLLYRLTLTLRGPHRAIQATWIYTSLFIPIFFLVRSFDVLTTFLILLGLYALIKHKNMLLAVAIGLGTMVKILPLLLLATIWRTRGLSAALKYGGVVLLMSLIILGPFFIANPTMTWASLLAQPSKSSYQTVWALFDGNDSTGNFGPLSDHFDPAKATQPLNNPPKIPTWVTLIPFGLLGLFIFTRPRQTDIKQDIILFTTLTFVVFFLWSPGWSPQWQTFLIPLLLLAFPEKRAVLFIILLGFINLLEWPVILSRDLSQLLPVTVLARTFLFIIIAVELYRMLTRPTHST